MNNAEMLVGPLILIACLLGMAIGQYRHTQKWVAWHKKHQAETEPRAGRDLEGASPVSLAGIEKP